LSAHGVYRGLRVLAVLVVVFFSSGASISSSYRHLEGGKNEFGQVVLTKHGRLPRLHVQTRPQTNNQTLATRPGNCPGPPALSSARPRGVGWVSRRLGVGHSRAERMKYLSEACHRAAVGRTESRNAARVQQVHSFADAVPVCALAWRTSSPPSALRGNTCRQRLQRVEILHHKSAPLRPTSKQLYTVARLKHARTSGVATRSAALLHNRSLLHHAEDRCAERMAERMERMITGP